MSSNSGVYCIKNICNNKVYIGSTSNLRQRRIQHFKKLSNNSHPNYHLQFTYNKYGDNNFKYIIIEEVQSNNILSREQYWIDYYKSTNRIFGYNISPKANRTEHSNETKLILSEISTERFKNPEERKKISDTLKRKGITPPSRKGCSMSEEAKRNISKSSKGRKFSDETRRIISDNMKRIWRERRGE